MDATDPAALPKRRSEAVESLLKEVRERVFHARDKTPATLVAGIWYPWSRLCVVALVGEMDLQNASTVTEALAGRLGAGPCNLVVDLSGLEFADSSGIHALVRAAAETKTSGGMIVFASPQANVARLFEILKFGDAFTVVPTLEEALSRLTPAHEADSQGETIGEVNDGGVIRAPVRVRCECGRADCMEQIELSVASLDVMRRMPGCSPLKRGHENPTIEWIVAVERDYVLSKKRLLTKDAEPARSANSGSLPGEQPPRSGKTLDRC